MIYLVIGADNGIKKSKSWEIDVVQDTLAQIEPDQWNNIPYPIVEGMKSIY